VRTGLLRGSEHTDLGAVAALAEGSCAIALSRGGYAKGYRHRDANEDAVAFALGPAGALLAVADGHGGHEAAELALELLCAGFGEAWTGAGALAPWAHSAGEALASLHGAIVERGLGESGNPEARSTLALALARPRDDLLAFASVGDSHVFVAEAARAFDLAAARGGEPVYLGSPALDPGELVARALIGAGPLAGARALALATDGLSERGIGVPAPEHAVLDSLARARRADAGLRPLETARCLVECALAAHRRNRSGDNVAAAVLIVAE
jgi:serine/threonine protein phosphatase PrpC